VRFVRGFDRATRTPQQANFHIVIKVVDRALDEQLSLRLRVSKHPETITAQLKDTVLSGRKPPDECEDGHFCACYVYSRASIRHHGHYYLLLELRNGHHVALLVQEVIVKGVNEWTQCLESRILSHDPPVTSFRGRLCSQPECGNCHFYYHVSGSAVKMIYQTGGPAARPGRTTRKQAANARGFSSLRVGLARGIRARPASRWYACTS
jgi:hypothetical protein